MHYILFYEVSDDYLERRAQFRDAHLAMAWKSSDSGNLVLGGALANPADTAVLLFKGDSPGSRGRVREGGSIRSQWHREALVCARVDDSCGGRLRKSQAACRNSICDLKWPVCTLDQLRV